MKRREFLKLSCTGCLLGATGWLSASGLLSCSSPKNLAVYKAPVVNKQVEVPLDQLAHQEVTLIRGKGMEYDIAVHRTGDGSYMALLMRCTHFNNPLTQTGNGFHCDLHGSEFDKDGHVKKGPASKPLEQFRCELAGNKLVIHL